MSKTKKRKVVENKDKVVEVNTKSSGRRRMELGNSEDTARRDSFKVQELRPDYSSGENVYVLLEAGYEVVQEHWFDVDGKAERVVCAVMGIEEAALREEKADNTYGYPDGCEPCAVMDDLYKSYPKNSGDVANDRARKVAGKISSRQSVYLIAGKGDLIKVRDAKTRKTNTEPDFSGGLVGKKLKLSGNAFKVLYDGIKENGFSKEKLVGMPFNLVGGRKQGNSHVIDRVDFFPEFKLKKLPKSRVTLNNVCVYDSERMEKIFGLFKKVLPDFLSGKKNIDSRSKTRAKSKTRVTGRSRRR